MKIHEYQGKEILKKYGVPVPRAIPAFSVAEAIEAAKALGGSVWVVKAQIHAGGRGKGGGVKVAKSMDELTQFATEILGMQLVTHQTGPAGQKVRRLLIEEGADIQKEYYLGMVVDRGTQKICIMASSEGGMDIEHVAEHTPELIHKAFVSPSEGLTDELADDLSRKMGMPEASITGARVALQGLYKAFVETDADLAEINPLITTGDGKVVALDAKMNFDANALFRHPEIVEMRDLDEEDPAEIEASKFDLAYISLDGNIGCLVNGAGLAMATMDTIKLYGGEPANFLDVGGGATAEKVTEAFKIMLKNPDLKAILVNIFGGIMRCDVIAEGVITAAKQVKLQVPLVVRMKGTNEDLGKKMLAESGLPIIAADSMADAAEKVVNATRGTGVTAALVGGGVAIAATAEGVYDAVVDGAEKVIDGIGDVVSKVGSVAGSVVDGAGNAVVDAAHAVGDVADSVVDTASETIEQIGKGVASVGAGAIAVGATALSAAGDGAEKAAGGVMGLIKRFWWLLPLFLIAAFLFKSFGHKNDMDQPPAMPVATEAPVTTPVAKEAAPVVAAPVTPAVATPTEEVKTTKSDDKMATASKGAALLQVNFATGSAVIPVSAHANLNKFAAELVKSAKAGEISGHTDNVGNAANNTSLSAARAKAVVAYLVKQGVPVASLTAKGYGQEKAIADNTSEQGRSHNRRVEFIAR